MEAKFQLSCESPVDMPYSYIHDERNISVLFYTYMVDGVVHEDNMGRDPEAMSAFYQMLADGAMPSTSQVNPMIYEQYLEDLLQKGDVLHIALGSGMSPSVTNACEAAERLRVKYPDRKLVVLDSLCSSSGYGMLVECAADLRDRGASLDEVVEWGMANRNKLHHQFFSTDLTMYKRSGRVSGPEATIGTVLGICPLMRLNDKGAIIAYARVRGKNKAVRETAETVMAHIQNGREYNGKLSINHSNAPELAEAVKKELIPYLGDLAANAPIYEIGSIIASHCGPGTVAVFFFGDERVE